MKALVLILLLFSGVPDILRARQSSSIQEPADVAVVKFSWRKERLPGWENNPFGPSFETYDAMRARLDNERRIQQARNAGNKTELGKRESAAKMVEDASLPKNTQKAERPRDGYRYKVLVNNNGTKTIKLVDWDYIFFDPNTLAEVTRYQFTSEEKVRPGKDKELGVLILSPPTRTVSARSPESREAPPLVERVILVRVEYSDGSIWQRP